MVRDWLDWLLGEGLGPTYRATLFDLLSSILSAAVEDRRIHSNPCRARSVKKPKAPARKVIPWTTDRLHLVEAGLAEVHRAIIHLGAGCDLRQGEILGYSPVDIDRDGQVLHVVRQLRTVERTLVFAPPKGGKTRSVPLSDGVLAALDDHATDFKPQAVTLPWVHPRGVPTTVDLALVRDNGSVISGDLFTKVVWKNAFRRAGLLFVPREDGMHALRHFFASTLLARGVSIKELAEYLGHADPGFTLRTYTHLVPSSHERARAAMDDVFGRPDGLETA